MEWEIFSIIPIIVRKFKNDLNNYDFPVHYSKCYLFFVISLKTNNMKIKIRAKMIIEYKNQKK